MQEERFIPDKEPDLPQQEPDDLEAELPPSGLELWASARSEKQWKKLQIIGGIVLGIAGGLSLFYLGASDSSSSVGLIVTIVLMMVLPNLLQRNLSRSINLGRNVAIGAFGFVLLVYFLMHWPWAH